MILRTRPARPRGSLQEPLLSALFWLVLDPQPGGLKHCRSHRTAPLSAREIPWLRYGAAVIATALVLCSTLSLTTSKRGQGLCGTGNAGSHAPHRDDVVPQNMYLHVSVLEDGL